MAQIVAGRCEEARFGQISLRGPQFGGVAARLLHLQLGDQIRVLDTCAKQTLPGTSADGYKMGCTATGGTVSDKCSSKGVLGCCTISISEVCYYKDGGLSEDDCTQAGGTYSPTP